MRLQNWFLTIRFIDYHFYFYNHTLSSLFLMLSGVFKKDMEDPYEYCTMSSAFIKGMNPKKDGISDVHLNHSNSTNSA